MYWSLLALLGFVELVLQLLDLALQRLHLLLQRLVLIDEIDGVAALPARLLLLETLDALGQRKPLRARGQCNDGGPEDRRRHQARAQNLRCVHGYHFAV